VLINTSATVRQPLVVQLVGTQANRDAIGGTAILTTDRRRLLRQVKGGGSYLSAGSRALAWGLADKEKPLSLAVRWPGGELIELPWGKATGRYLIREGARGATPGVIPVDTATGRD
jgi:enediyne biosynthesis protein E4